MSTPMGTWIHGTHRPQDLMPALLDLLAEVHPEAYEQCFQLVPAHAMEDEEATWWTDEAPSHLEGLFDSLDECAPDGYYFGAHPGDGSDFGYWPDGYQGCLHDEHLIEVGGKDVDLRDHIGHLGSFARQMAFRLQPYQAAFVVSLNSPGGRVAGPLAGAIAPYPTKASKLEREAPPRNLQAGPARKGKGGKLKRW